MIPRVDQVCLIRASKAVLQPSRFEGWSTVIEDARALGKATIASNFPVHIEQDAPGSSFFRMGDPDDCALAISRFLEKDRPFPYSPSLHDARILDFARKFMEIVNATLSRPSAYVAENELQPSK
jgi:glycosyltransferase involved in cell wall biosynthesis